MVYIAAAVLLGVIFLFFYAKMERSKTLYYTAYAKNAKAFFAITDQLLAREHISADLLAVLEFMVSRIDDRTMAGQLYHAVKAGYSAGEGKAAPVGFAKQAGKADSKEIEELFYKAFRLWLLAIFNHAPFYSFKMLAVLNEPEKKIVRNMAQNWAIHKPA